MSLATVRTRVLSFCDYCNTRQFKSAIVSAQVFIILADINVLYQTAIVLPVAVWGST